MSSPDLRSLEDALRAHVERLARAPRVPESREHSDAAAYIRGRLEDAGFGVEEKRSRSGDLPCANFITRPVPDRADLPLVVVGAHHDTVPGSPGADDNASAVAALLELARWIGPRVAEGGLAAARLVLAAYDLEEYGFGGSSLHAGELARSQTPLAGMIALEMLGFTGTRQEIPPLLRGRYPETGTFIGVVGNERSRDLMGVVEAALRSVPGLPVESLAVPGAGEAIPETRLSDHSPFWDLGFPALMVTDTSFLRNPHYHQASDTPDTLDYSFLARVTAGICAAVERLCLEGQLNP